MPLCLLQLDTIHTLENQIRIICPKSFLQKISLYGTRTYGSDLLGVYDIQEPIYNCLEDIIYTTKKLQVLRNAIPR